VLHLLMNPSITDSSHPSFVYYDSDYPSREFSSYPGNFDSSVWKQGIGDDVDAYQRIAHENGNKVLELCCGTGRMSIPFAMSGLKVTGVDISPALLKRFRGKVNKIENFPNENINIVRHDVATLSLPVKNYDLVVCAFNSLLCIPDFKQQQDTIIRAAEHLRPEGVFALDIANPLALNLHGDERPELFFTRRRTDNGNTYSRFCASGPIDVNQIQPIFGWYDETDSRGIITRRSYSLEWRLIFRFELELMLENAGFRITKISGGNNNEPLLPSSLKMFVEATLR
jgi:SAM-dependent methyltransferase